MIIGKREKITPSALGKHLDMQKGSLTTLIDSLEEMNLVSRAPDPNDRRKTLLQLTKEGEDYRQLKMEEFKKNLVILFDSLPEEEIEDFAKNLENIVNTIKKV